MGIRRCFVRALGVVVALGLAVPQAASLPLGGPHNDAGTGGDAPADCSAGLFLAEGAYEGRLTSLKSRPLAASTPVTDAADCYRFFVSAGDRVLARLDGRPNSALTYEIHARLAAPSGAFAAGLSVLGPTGLDESRLVAIASGYWTLRVFTLEDGGPYGFTLRTEPVSNPTEAAAGEGYLAVTVRLGTTGRITVLMNQEFERLGGLPFLVRQREILAGGAGGFAGSLSGDSTDPFMHVHGAGASADAQVTEDVNQLWGSRFVRRDIAAPNHVPGEYTWVIYAAGAAAYNQLEVQLTGDTSLVGFSQGGSATVHALRAKDFDGGAGVATPLARVTSGASAAVDIAAALVGTFRCPSEPYASACSWQAPDGSAGQVQDGFQEFILGAPGEWTLRLDDDVSDDRDDYVAVLVDVDLP